MGSFAGMEGAGARASDVLERGRRIAEEVDPRLADVWAYLFEADLAPEELARNIGWLLRMAYLAGYQDGRSEPVPGALLRILGAGVDRRAGRGTGKGDAR